jgi:hypothetical protein
MGSRGPRSAADLASYRPQPANDRPQTRIDVDQLARQFGDKREALRSLKRAERFGDVVSRTMPDGTVEWYRTT